LEGTWDHGFVALSAVDSAEIPFVVVGSAFGDRSTALSDDFFGPPCVVDATAPTAAECFADDTGATFGFFEALGFASKEAQLIFFDAVPQGLPYCNFVSVRHDAIKHKLAKIYTENDSIKQFQGWRTRSPAYDHPAMTHRQIYNN
jgi:hypothetical protein